MLKLDFARDRRALKLLCIGAHSDDLEIGCCGTIVETLRRHPGSSVTWVVLSADGEREFEARRSARSLLKGAKNFELVLGEFTDSHFPARFSELKRLFERVKDQFDPDLVFTHRLEDRHQDHRLVSELTWQTWRDHIVLEYEIPKFEGDLGHPNLYVPLSVSTVERKLRHLMRYFGTQRNRAWFSPDTFSGIMRLRGIECRAPTGHAEAFTARKLVI